MSRLFVALDLPPHALSSLLARQPAAQAGIRHQPADQLHITIHFLGERDADVTIAALEAVRCPAFHIRLRGCGEFTSSDAITLWAGVEENPALTALHAEIARALAPSGFVPDDRPWRPHITLARCGLSLPPETIARFLAQDLEVEARVTAFGLYASTFVANAPVYTRERTFPLGSP